MILVAGATGNVGEELVLALARAGEPVRALVRDTHRELPRGVEAAVADLNEARSLRGALEGTDGMFLLSGYDTDGVLAEARAAGVQRVVLLSGGAAGATRLDNPISQYQLRSERAVGDSGLEWTIMRPYGFMSNALQWAPQLRAGDVVRAPFARVPVAVVDPYDIAAVAATALLEGGHAGETCELSGPEALLPSERVSMLASVLGRQLRFEAQCDEEARAEMGGTMPAEYVDAFFSFYVGGAIDESQPSSAVRQVTGSEPRTFTQWAQAHASAFQ